MISKFDIYLAKQLFVSPSKRASETVRKTTMQYFFCFLRQKSQLDCNENNYAICFISLGKRVSETVMKTCAYHDVTLSPHQTELKKEALTTEGNLVNNSIALIKPKKY